MHLLIDIGNSTILAAVADRQGSIMSSWRFDTIKGEAAQYFAEKLRRGLRNLQLSAKDIEQTSISSVVPEINGRIVDAIYSLTGSKPHFFALSDAQAMIDVDVDAPEQVGKDRLADAIGAAYTYGGAAIVIDFGTATTVGVISHERKFLGGMIIPGMKTAHRALCERASQLSPISEWKADSIIGRSTNACMQSGMMYGTACMIDGIIDRLSASMPSDYKVIATGGMAQYVVPYCRHSIIIDNHLLLKGIYHATKVKG